MKFKNDNNNKTYKPEKEQLKVKRIDYIQEKCQRKKEVETIKTFHFWTYRKEVFFMENQAPNFYFTYI